MPDYEAMYYAMAAQVAEAIDLLIQAQQQGERLAMECKGANLLFLSKPPSSDPDAHRHKPSFQR